jgi:hypothetical protein
MLPDHGDGAADQLGKPGESKVDRQERRPLHRFRHGCNFLHHEAAKRHARLLV